MITVKLLFFMGGVMKAYCRQVTPGFFKAFWLPDNSDSVQDLAPIHGLPTCDTKGEVIRLFAEMFRKDVLTLTLKKGEIVRKAEENFLPVMYREAEENSLDTYDRGEN